MAVLCDFGAKMIQVRQSGALLLGPIPTEAPAQLLEGETVAGKMTKSTGPEAEPAPDLRL
jgi:hypothetical protein